jgi:Zinc finger, C2H2 type
MTTRKVYRMKVENKPFICKKCNRGFTEERYLQNHLRRKIPCDKKFVCPKCKIECKTGSALYNHINRITSCVPDKIPVIDNTKNEFRCHFCDKTLANSYSLKRHISSNSCDQEKNMMYMMEKLIKQSEKREERMMNELGDLKQQLVENGITPVTNNVNINNIQNNLYVNVTICSFGKEDLSRLDTSKVMNLLKNNVGDFMPKMIEHVHANPEIPEFHNVFFDPEKGKAIVFTPISDSEQSWQMRNFAEVSAELTQKIKDHVRPGAGPYFDQAMQAKDSETSNSIIRIVGEIDWTSPEVLEQNMGVLTKIQQNQEFMELVDV